MDRRPVPIQYRQTQSYLQDLTKYNLGKGHGAIDYGTPEGVEVIAVEDGVVQLAGNSAGFPGAPDATATHADYVSRLYFLKGNGGNVVALRHGSYLSTYSHLSKIFVKPGQRVKKGQVIGLTGYSGNVVPPGPRGAHLHFEIIAVPHQWFNGFFGRVDPVPYLTEPYQKLSEAPIMAKAYKHETKWSTPWTQPRSFYGFPAKPTAITIHHWGNDGQKLEDVAYYHSDPKRDPRTATSSHTVLEDGRIATLAVPEVATFHSGSTAGNGSSIGIECRPEMTKGDVDTLVQYIYELEVVYGSLKIYFHEEWSATACPGRYKAIRADVISRVNAMHANGGRDPKLAVATTQASKPASKPAAKPKKGELDGKTITDIVGTNVAPLRQILKFRIDAVYRAFRADDKKLQTQIDSIKRELAELKKGA